MNLAAELTLLGYDTTASRSPTGCTSTTASAVLLEPALAGRIDVEGGRVVVRDADARHRMRAAAVVAATSASSGG